MIVGHVLSIYCNEQGSLSVHVVTFSSNLQQSTKLHASGLVANEIGQKGHTRQEASSFSSFSYF